MAVERFYSGDPLSASKFNRLVATVCNLRRKVAEIKRQPKANLLRNESFARYPANECAGCACGFINCYCVKLCVGQFPIYKPPFNMHWKTTEINGSEVRTGELVINRGHWFRGSSFVEVPSSVIGYVANGDYYVTWCGTEFVRGQSCKNISCNVWLIGVVRDGEIVHKWSGDIYQEPQPYKPNIVAITDHARFVSDQIVADSYGLPVDCNCKMTPARGVKTGSYENPPQHCDGAYMLFSGSATGNMSHGWFTGCVCVAGSIPQLRVCIHGRENDSGFYDGQQVYVNRGFENGYTYRCLVGGDVGVIVGYLRQDCYLCTAYSCVWVDVPIVPQQNAIAFWGAEQENCFHGTGSEISTCWTPHDGFTTLQRGSTEQLGGTELPNWKFVNYIADVVLCKKEPVDTVYSLPKKSTISETYYTGENCNGN